MAEARDTDVRKDPPRDGEASAALEDARLEMMRRIKRLPTAERIALLDRMCREQTRIAIGARRVR